MFGNIFNKKYELVEDIIDDLLKDIIFDFYTSFEKNKTLLVKKKLLINNTKKKYLNIYKNIKAFDDAQDENDDIYEIRNRFILFLQNFQKEDIVLIKRFNDAVKITQNINDANAFYEKIELTNKYNDLLNKYNDLINK